ncbi:MAG: hypothetical protein AAF368_09630, partial [Planctomycetota bacterium]
GTWIDSRVLRSTEPNLEPDEVIDFGSERHFALVADFAAEGRQAALAFDGRLLVEHEGKRLLVRNDTASSSAYTLPAHD